MKTVFGFFLFISILAMTMSCNGATTATANDAAKITSVLYTNLVSVYPDIASSVAGGAPLNGTKDCSIAGTVKGELTVNNGNCSSNVCDGTVKVTTSNCQTDWSTCRSSATLDGDSTLTFNYAAGVYSLKVTGSQTITSALINGGKAITCDINISLTSTSLSSGFTTDHFTGTICGNDVATLKTLMADTSKLCVAASEIE